MNLEIIIIAAMTENRVIGKDGGIPWRAPTDMRQRFVKETRGCPIIGGRKTMMGLRLPLRDRVNIMVSRSVLTVPAHVFVAKTPARALAIAQDQEKGRVFVIGGAELYEIFLSAPPEQRATHMLLTLVQDEGAVTGDTFFPDFEWGDWRETRRSNPVQNEGDDYPLVFVDLVRKD